MADRPTDRADFNRRMSDKIKKEDFVRLDLSLIYPAAASAALVMPRCSFTNFWPDGKTYRSSVHTMLRPSFDRDSSIESSIGRTIEPSAGQGMLFQNQTPICLWMRSEEEAAAFLLFNSRPNEGKGQGSRLHYKIHSWTLLNLSMECQISQKMCNILSAWPTSPFISVGASKVPISLSL